MLPEGRLLVDGTEGRRDVTTGGSPLKPTPEILSARDPVGRGNAIPTDSISTQPLPAAAPAAEASADAASSEMPRCELQKPTYPQCGLAVPHHSPSPGLRQKQGSGTSVYSSKRCRGKVAASHRPAASPAPDSCLQLLLACLFCQGSVLLLGLLEACSSCLHTLCSSCCHACAHCCSAIQEVPVEETSCHTHCHSVLFESCCEPAECLELCLECCEICHRS